MKRTGERGPEDISELFNVIVACKNSFYGEEIFKIRAKRYQRSGQEGGCQVIETEQLDQGSWRQGSGIKASPTTTTLL